MKIPTLPQLIFPVLLCALSSCDRVEELLQEKKGGGAFENIDAEERAAAVKLKRVKDPTQEEIYAFCLATRKDYNERRFDQLEKQARELRTSKQVFRNGSWKIVQFYQAFECDDREPESMWQLHDRVHQDWIAAKPDSITAHVAYADFLTSYAWRARGSGWADKVTEKGWELFAERLNAAGEVLGKSRTLPEKDPVWWMAGLRVALGTGMSKPDYDVLVEEAHAHEPKFWGYDTARAYSLLPRWHGEPGEWETFAEKSAARPDGLGSEVYARIVINLHGFHENIFRESKASWPKTREGLAQLRQKYPDSLGLVNVSAKLATMAEDRDLAKQMFDQLGDTYLAGCWSKPVQFTHYRKWATTGQW